MNRFFLDLVVFAAALDKFFDGVVFDEQSNMYMFSGLILFYLVETIY